MLEIKAAEIFQAVELSTERYIFKSSDAQSQVKHQDKTPIISKMEVYWRLQFLYQKNTYF